MVNDHNHGKSIDGSLVVSTLYLREMIKQYCVQRIADQLH